MNREEALKLWDELYLKEEIAYDYASHPMKRDLFEDSSSPLGWTIDVIQYNPSCYIDKRFNYIPCSIFVKQLREEKNCFKIGKHIFEVRKGKNHGQYIIYDITDKEHPLNMDPSDENQDKEFNLKRKRDISGVTQSEEDLIQKKEEIEDVIENTEREINVIEEIKNTKENVSIQGQEDSIIDKENYDEKIIYDDDFDDVNEEIKENTTDLKEKEDENKVDDDSKQMQVESSSHQNGIFSYSTLKEETGFVDFKKEELEEKIEKLTQQKEFLISEAKGYKDERDNLIKEIKDKNDENNSDLSSFLKDVKNTHEYLSSSCQNMISSYEKLNEKYSLLEDEYQRLKDVTERENVDKKAYRDERDNLIKENEILKKDNNKIKDIQSRLKESEDIKKANDLLVSSNRELIKANEDNQKEIDSLLKEKDELKEEISSLKEKNESLLKDIDYSSSKEDIIDALKEDNMTLRESISSLKQEMEEDSIEEDIVILEEEIKEKDNEIFSLNEKLKEKSEEKVEKEIIEKVVFDENLYLEYLYLKYGGSDEKFVKFKEIYKEDISEENVKLYLLNNTEYLKEDKSKELEDIKKSNQLLIVSNRELIEKNNLLKQEKEKGITLVQEENNHLKDELKNAIDSKKEAEFALNRLNATIDPKEEIAKKYFRMKYGVNTHEVVDFADKYIRYGNYNDITSKYGWNYVLLDESKEDCADNIDNVLIASLDSLSNFSRDDSFYVNSRVFYIAHDENTGKPYIKADDYLADPENFAEAYSLSLRTMNKRISLPYILVRFINIDEDYDSGNEKLFTNLISLAINKRYKELVIDCKHEKNYLFITLDSRRVNCYNDGLVLATLINSYRKSLALREKANAIIVYNKVECPLSCIHLSYYNIMKGTKDLDMEEIYFELIQEQVVSSIIRPSMYIGPNLIGDGLDLSGKKLKWADFVSQEFIDLYKKEIPSLNDKESLKYVEYRYVLWKD